MDKEGLLEGGRAQQEQTGPGRIEGLRSTLAHLAGEWQEKSRWWLRNKAQEGKREADGRASWRRKLGNVLDSTAVHAFIVALLLLDLLATVVDVLHTLHNDTQDLSQCVAMVEACSCTASFNLSEAWEFLYWIGIAVLCVLALNLVGLLLSFGLAFFRHPGYVLDLVVVVTALFLEIFLDTETAGLLVILNLWRIIRVAHGVFEVTDEAWEKKLHDLEDRIQSVEAVHLEDLSTIHHLQLQVSDLQRRLYPSSLYQEATS